MSYYTDINQEEDEKKRQPVPQQIPTPDIQQAEPSATQKQVWINPPTQNNYEPPIKRPVYNFDSQKFMEDMKDYSGPAIEFAKRYLTPPEPEISPEDARRAKFASALTDTFKTLGEMYASGQGAHIRNRSGEESSTSRTNSTLQRMRDKDRQEQQKFQNILYGSAMRDYTQKYNEAQNKANRDYNWDMYRAQTEDLNKREKERNNYALQKELLRQLYEEQQYQKHRGDKLEDEKNIIEYRNSHKSSGGSGAGNSGNGGVGSMKGYTDLQDSKGNYLRVPTSAWNNTALDLYGEMVNRGVLPKLTIQGKDYLTGMPYEKDVLEPSQISAYVARNADKIPDDLWKKIKARASGQGYVNPAQQQSAKQPQATATQTEPAWKLPQLNKKFGRPY